MLENITVSLKYISFLEAFYLELESGIIFFGLRNYFTWYII